MYLSRLMLDRRMRAPQLRRDIRSPYEMHRTIMRGFPPDCNGDGERVLWRMDVDRRNGASVVYIVSATSPDWKVLETEHPGYLDSPPDVPKEYPPRIAEGTLLRFRLRANPTKRSKTSGKRIGLVDENDQFAWLRRKGEAGGFVVSQAIAVREDQPDALAKGRKGGKDGMKLSLLSVRFDGICRVTDPEAFGRTLVSGIGPGKAFGFGLLSVAPCG